MGAFGQDDLVVEQRQLALMFVQKAKLAVILGQPTSLSMSHYSVEKAAHSEFLASSTVPHHGFNSSRQSESRS